MEAVTTPTLGPGHTRDDLDRMPEDGNRYELLEGEIVMSPSPRYVHQRISSRLHVLLAASCPQEWIVLFAPFDVELAADTVVEPDLLVVELDGAGGHGGNYACGRAGDGGGVRQAGTNENARRRRAFS